MNSATLLAAAVTVLVGLLLAVVRRVPEGQAISLHRFGRYRRTLGPGWHLVLPLVERVALRVTLVGHHVAVHDDAHGGTDAEVYYQILEPARAGRALADVDGLVQRETAERLHALTGEADGSDLPALAPRLKDELNRQLNRLGLLVIRCQLHLPGTS